MKNEEIPDDRNWGVYVVELTDGAWSGGLSWHIYKFWKWDIIINVYVGIFWSHFSEATTDYKILKTFRLFWHSRFLRQGIENCWRKRCVKLCNVNPLGIEVIGTFGNMWHTRPLKNVPLWFFCPKIVVAVIIDGSILHLSISNIFTA